MTVEILPRVEEIDLKEFLRPKGMKKFSDALYSRKTKGLNTIVLIVGARGIGKSYLALKLGEKYDKEFTVDNVVFDMEEFLIMLKKVSPYAFIVFDEAGLEVAARDFMTTINKIMSYVSQSFRRTAVNLIVVVPNPDMVDVHVRLLADFWIVVKTRGKGTMYKTKMNPFRSNQVLTRKFCNLRIGLPSDELSEVYEKKRKEKLGERYDAYLSEVKRKREKKEALPVDKFKAALNLYEQLIKEKLPKKKIAYEIQSKLGISLSYAYLLKHQVEAQLKSIPAKE